LFATVQAETLVVANKAEATASLIDLDSGEVVATLPTDNGPHEVAVSPDGRIALVANYGHRGSSGRSLTVIDITAAKVIKTIDLGVYERPHGVEWLDNRRAAVTVEANRALVVVDVNEGTVIQEIGTDQEISHMVAIDPDRQRAYVANIGSGSVTVLDLQKGERTKNIVTGEGAEGVAVSASGRHVWVTNRDADTITILDADTFEKVREIPSESFPIRATATPTGQVLVTRARSGDMAIYDTRTMEEVRTVEFDLRSMDVEERLFGDRFGDSSVPIGVIVNGTGEHAFVAHANADVITEVDLGTGEIVRTLRAGKEPDGMGFSPLSAKR
jgi:YVTN family beta-propeller protein